MATQEQENCGARRAEYRRTHAEEIKASSAAYRAKNAAQINARKAEYRKNNREMLSRKTREWYANNKAKFEAERTRSDYVLLETGRRAHNRKGYVLVRCPGHPRSGICTKMVMEHILVAEKALGKYLPLGAVVHHVNGVENDNRNGNLVICQDHAYHFLLHRRQRIQAAGGNPNTDKICGRCKTVQPLGNFRPCRSTPDGVAQYCGPCATEKRRAYEAQRNNNKLAN